MESQLLIAVQDLAIGLNNLQQLDTIWLDFSKAFDKVPHQGFWSSWNTTELEEQL